MISDRTILVGNLIEAAEYALEVLDGYADIVDAADDTSHPTANRAMLASVDLSKALKALAHYDNQRFEEGTTL